MPNKYDVVVVGAGPAGSTAAKFLAENGVNVLLLDKERFPRPKPCSGWITPRVIDSFPYILDHGDLIDSYDYGMFIHSPSGQYVAKIRRDKPINASVLRERFDYGLLNIAIESGADFHAPAKVNEIRIGKGVEIVLDDRNIRAEAVIGADGARSSVARSSGLFTGWGRSHTGMCLVKEFRVGSDILDRYFTEERYSHIHVSFSGIHGYGWVHPKKENLNIGVVCLHSKMRFNLMDVLRAYFQMLKSYRVIPNDLSPEHCVGWTMPYARTLRRTYANRILLCGDAAGFVNPFSGEGIYYAMRSGEHAAHTMVSAVNAGNFTKKHLSAYQKAWRKDFGGDLKTFLNISRLIFGGLNESFVKVSAKDERMRNLFVDVSSGSRNIKDCKTEMIVRGSWDLFKDLFGAL